MGEGDCIATPKKEHEMLLHKHNYQKHLGGTSLKFTTILERAKRCCSASIREVSERELWISDKYNQLSVIDKAVMLQVCEKSIEDIERLENGAQYLPRWIELRDFLASEAISKESEKDSFLEEIKGAFLTSYTKNTAEVTPSALLITIPIFNLSDTDRMELEMKPELFFFAKDHIPFVLSAFHSLCFRVPLLDGKYLDRVDSVHVRIVDAKAKKVLAETTHELPQNCSVKLRNILEHSPYKNIEERAKRALELTDLIPDYDMLVLGKKISA